METLRQIAESNLCEAILREAESQGDEIIRRAKAQAAGLIAQAEAEADKSRREKLAVAEAEAARRREAVLATVSIEASRERSARVAALTQTIFEQARHRLVARLDYDYRACLVDLAAEALGQMHDDAFVVRLSPADRVTYGNGLAGEIADRVKHRAGSISFVEDPSITDGGLVVQDAEGRRVWDNRLPQRLERMWPELRRQIAVRTALVAENAATEGKT